MDYVKIFRKKYGLVQGLYLKKFLLCSENAVRLHEMPFDFRQIAEPFGKASKQW